MITPGDDLEGDNICLTHLLCYLIVMVIFTTKVVFYLYKFLQSRFYTLWLKIENAFPTKLTNDHILSSFMI